MTKVLHDLFMLEATRVLKTLGGGNSKVTQVTIVNVYCQQKHMSNLSNSSLGDGQRIQL